MTRHHAHPLRPHLFLALSVVLTVVITGSWHGTAETRAQRSDLDAFMERVLGRRDDNWRKLQQYVLDERETVEVLAPGRVRVFGLDREYTWFIREGVFVRSPVKANGVTVSESDRRAAEERWITREREREAKRTSTIRSNEGTESQGGETPTADAPAAVGDVLRQEPQFVSAAYFLRFRFEPGRYALVGRERLDGREVVRVEYYPARLFRDEDEDPVEGKDRGGERQHEDRIREQMNKVSLVSLVIDPTTFQIVEYTFDNVGFDFLPGRTFVRIDDTTAMMRMREAFPDVWLPAGIEARVALAVAAGTYVAHYRVAYENHRLADVKVQIR